MNNENWKGIRFKVSPELYDKLMVIKGNKKWWEFFRDEFADRKVDLKPVVRSYGQEFKEFMGE